ncbi:MAG TPA: hypothetical protein VI999_00930 [Thermoplasmata archaeon]|nr:hypothetical protein [Thermoplasmata archaeon]
MVVAGLCYLCNRPSTVSCAACGRLVCRDHLAVGPGPLCIECARGRIVPGRPGNR